VAAGLEAEYRQRCDLRRTGVKHMTEAGATALRVVVVADWGTAV
jgi:hypothetical protein